MISVICIWLYMLFTCYVVGFACVKMISGKTKWHVRGEIGYLYAGIGAVTVYAQAFSLFYKVGFWANVLLVLGCFVCLILFREEFAAQFHSFRLTVTLPGLLVVITLFLLFSYGTSRGIIHYDTGLYHAQSIRWIEEYGVVPGLGNLHSRLAYNSASFCLSALYSMAFLGTCIAGWLITALLFVCRLFTVWLFWEAGLFTVVRVFWLFYCRWCV